MAKTLSRFYFLKKDEYKEKATLFVRVQDPNRRIDVQFTTRIQVGVPEWKAAVADEDSLARHRKQNPKLHDKLGRIEVMLEREMSAPQFDRQHVKSEILAISNPERYEIPTCSEGSGTTCEARGGTYPARTGAAYSGRYCGRESQDMELSFGFLC